MPLITGVTVINRTLADHLGQDPIALGDGSRADLILSPMLDMLRREVLAACPWAFCASRASIDADATPPAFEYGARYSLPADYLQARDIYNWRGAWKVEGAYMLTDAPAPLLLRYSFDQIVYGAWEPLAIELLSLKLARAGVMGITGSLELRDRLDKDIKTKMLEATFRTRTQQTARELDADIWLTSRYQGRQESL